MKIQIRHGVFETNSSSVHSVTILNDEDYNKWINGKTIVSRHGKFVPIEEADLSSYEFDQDYIDTEEAETVINGEKIHAVSVYAEDY